MATTYELFRLLRTSHGALNLEYLRRHVDFPVYFIGETGMGLTCAWFKASIDRFPGREGINEIVLGYISSEPEHNTSLIVLHCGKKPDKPLDVNQPFPVVYPPFDLLTNLAARSPARFKSPNYWGDLQYIWSSPVDPDYDLAPIWRFCQQIVWESLEVSKLNFKLFYQIEPGPLSLLFTEERTSYLAVGSVGVLRYEIEEMLKSLICLQQSDADTMKRLQDKLDADALKQSG